MYTMILNKISIIFALVIYDSRIIYTLPSQTYNQNYQPNYFNYHSIYYETSTNPALDPIYEEQVSITPIQTDYHEGDQVSYRSIQYAPVVSMSENKIFDKDKNEDKDSTVTEINLADSDANKSNIEPRLEVDEKPVAESRTTIVYGHNIHVPHLENFSPETSLVEKEDEFTTKESEKQDVYANPLMYNYGAKYQQTEQTPEDIDYNVVNHRMLLTKPNTSEHVYPVLSKYYKNSVSIIDGRLLYEKETPLIQPQLVQHARPYRIHLNTARAYNNINLPPKSMLINKILPPPCRSFDKLDSTHLDAPSSKHTKLYAIHNNCIYRRL